MTDGTPKRTGAEPIMGRGRKYGLKKTFTCMGNGRINLPLLTITTGGPEVRPAPIQPPDTRQPFPAHPVRGTCLRAGLRMKGLRCLPGRKGKNIRRMQTPPFMRHGRRKPGSRRKGRKQPLPLMRTAERWRAGILPQRLAIPLPFQSAPKKAMNLWAGMAVMPVWGRQGEVILSPVTLP